MVCQRDNWHKRLDLFERDNRLRRYRATGQKSGSVLHRRNDDAFNTVQHITLAVLDKVSASH